MRGAPQVPGILPPPPSAQDPRLSRSAAVALHKAKEERRAAEAVPVLQQIAERAGIGPLALLKRAYDGGGRVRVVTRHARGVRGTATGALRCPPFGKLIAGASMCSMLQMLDRQACIVDLMRPCASF